MSKNIKAIPTRYKGVQMRSKLEAFWAEKLDEMDIKWVYEPTTLTTSWGEWYVPDFWLEDIKTILEVKGRHNIGIEKTFDVAEVGPYPTDGERYEITNGKPASLNWLVIVGREEGEMECLDAKGVTSVIYIKKCSICHSFWFDVFSEDYCRKCGGDGFMSGEKNDTSGFWTKCR